MSALQLAQYLYSSKSLDTEKQFDDVNVRFLADIPRALVQSYARFEADLGYLAFYLNWYSVMMTSLIVNPQALMLKRLTLKPQPQALNPLALSRSSPFLSSWKSLFSVKDHHLARSDSSPQRCDSV